MESFTILVLVGLTSLGAYLVGTWVLHLSGDALGAVVGPLLESAGLTLLFFLLNLGVGAAALLALRTLTGAFLPLYAVNDVTVLVLSLLQALAFQRWRATSRAS